MLFEGLLNFAFMNDLTQNRPCSFNDTLHEQFIMLVFYVFDTFMLLSKCYLCIQRLLHRLKMYRSFDNIW